MALNKKKTSATDATAPETAVKPVEEKAASKKAARSVLKKDAPKKETVEEVYLQTGGTEWNISDCKARIAAAYVAEGHRASSIKKLVIYLKPEEGKAYFVINDGVNGSIDL